MSFTNFLLYKQSPIININLSNSDLEKLESLNKTMSANIAQMNKRVDFLILKLINLFIFLFNNKYENENENELLTFYPAHRLK
jgi:hypothetical protein